MAVDPLSRSGVPLPDLPRSQESRRSEPVGGSTSKTQPGTEGVLLGDTLELSPEALTLARSEPVPAGTISPQRLGEIRQRLNDGTYQSAEAMGTIAERLATGIPVPVGWGSGA